MHTFDLDSFLVSNTAERYESRHNSSISGHKISTYRLYRQYIPDPTDIVQGVRRCVPYISDLLDTFLGACNFVIHFGLFDFVQVERQYVMYFGPI